MHPVRKLIESTPKGTAFTREGLLEAWDKAGDLQDDSWEYVPTERAAVIMDVPETTARSRARRWWAMQQDGKTPPARVRADMSESGKVVGWYFHEGDCWKLRREAGGGPRPVDAGTDAGSEDEALDERAATIQMYRDVAAGRRPPPCTA